MRMVVVPPALFEVAREKCLRLVEYLTPPAGALYIGITHRDGKVAAEVATSSSASVDFELEPADAMRLALELKKHAELAAQQRERRPVAVERR